MKKRLMTALVPLLLLTGCGPKSDAPPAAEAEVRAAWKEFKNASLSGNGSVAASRVIDATHAYYDEVRRLALYADRQALAAFVFAKRYTVLGMRLRMSAEQLRSMSGRELFVHSVNQGWIGKNNATDEGVGAVTVTGDHARCVATKNGKATGQYLHFVGEAGAWKLDMMQLMTTVNVMFDQMLRESGMTEDAFTRKFLEATTGRTVTEDLWKPPEAEQGAAPLPPAPQTGPSEDAR